MALCKCALCGEPFNSFGSELCAPCAQETDEAYVKIRKYIYQNPEKAAFSAIVEATGVSEKTLNYLIDQGRIVIRGTVGGKTRCRACGGETGGETLCERCRSRLVSAKLISGEPATKDDCFAAGRWKAKPLGMQKP